MTTTDLPSVLRGPDPEQFRAEVYGSRWYIDPLPADTTWPATTDKWPSVTTIKKAWSKPFRKKLPTGDTVPLDAYWAAEFTVDNLPAINALADDKPAVMALICGAGKRTLNRAAERGTGVHAVLEDLAAGEEPDELLADPAVRPYIPACRQFITDWAPIWIVTEFVVINRTIGFGGTGDAIVIVDIPGGGRYVALTDWKSRGGKHGCYEEEVAQIGGYTLADYIIVTGPDGHPTRTSMPDLDGGLVVSLGHDGYQAYPVDLDQAQAAFRAMHASWTAQREGQKVARKARQRPLMPTTPTVVAPASPTGTTTDRVDWIRQRVVALGPEVVAPSWPTGVPTLKQGGLTDDHINAVASVLDRLEAKHGIPFGPSDPLFAGFVTADRAPAPPTPAAPAGPTPLEQAQAHTAEAKTLLEQFDQVDQDAIRDLIVPEGARTTARHVELLEAVCAELADPNGTVMFTYSTLGVEITPTDHGDRITATTRTKTEALSRAKRLARELGRPNPRTFADICIDPALAPLVAAGLGVADHQTINQETQTP